MKHVCCALVFMVALGMTLPSRAAAQMTTRPQAFVAPPPSAGASLAAAASNIFYFPARFVLTFVTAELGGITGWLTGGEQPAAQAVWDSTDGQAFITPEIIEGHEPLRLGPYQMGGTLPPEPERY